MTPITGMLRRRLIFHLASGTGLGVGAAYAFWYGFHVPSVKRRDAYYNKIEEARAALLSEE